MLFSEKYRRKALEQNAASCFSCWIINANAFMSAECSQLRSVLSQLPIQGRALSRLLEDKCVSATRDQKH